MRASGRVLTQPTGDRVRVRVPFRFVVAQPAAIDLLLHPRVVNRELLDRLGVDPIRATVAHGSDGDAAAIPGGTEKRARRRAAASRARPWHLHHRVECGGDGGAHRAHVVGVAVVECVAQDAGASSRGRLRSIGRGRRRRHAVAHDREHALTVDDVVAAGAAVTRLPLPKEQQARLTASVLTAALALVTDGAPAGSGTDGSAPVVLGYSLTERDVRLGLETTYRRLALQSPAGAERIALVDRANDLRPRTVL